MKSNPIYLSFLIFLNCLTLFSNELKNYTDSKLVKFDDFYRINSNYNSALFIDSSNILIGGDYGNLIFSTDSGKNWKRKFLESRNNIKSLIQFENTIIAIGEYGLFMESTDKGKKWSYNRNFRTNLERAVNYNNNLLMYDDSNNIFFSKDYGKSWTSNKLKDSAIIGIYIDSINILVATVNQNIYKIVFNDLSIINNLKPIQINSNKSSAKNYKFYNMNNKYYLSTEYEFYVFENQKWINLFTQSKITDIISFNQYSIKLLCINVELDSVFNASAQTFIPLYPNGKLSVLNFNILNKSIDTISSIPEYKLILPFPFKSGNTLNIINYNKLFIAVGGNNTILKSIDDGITWELESCLPHSQGNSSDIAFINDSIGFTNISAPYVSKTLNNGITWLPTKVDTFNFLNSSYNNFDNLYADGKKIIIHSSSITAISNDFGLTFNSKVYFDGTPFNKNTKFYSKLSDYYYFNSDFIGSHFVFLNDTSSNYFNNIIYNFPKNTSIKNSFRLDSEKIFVTGNDINGQFYSISKDWGKTWSTNIQFNNSGIHFFNGMDGVAIQGSGKNFNHFEAVITLDSGKSWNKLSILQDSVMQSSYNFQIFGGNSDEVYILKFSYNANDHDSIFIFDKSFKLVKKYENKILNKDIHGVSQLIKSKGDYFMIDNQNGYNLYTTIDDNKIEDLLIKDNIEFATEINNYPSILFYNAYPNPFNESLIVSFAYDNTVNLNNLKLSLYDYMGTKIDKFQYEITNISPYFFDIRISNILNSNNIFILSAQLGNRNAIAKIFKF